ncbi:alanine--tRNA ligase [Actinomadura rudentiformis]|uniref:Alanine--tRNA ligase n=1 Tax=Actinomadura rudentiformis TaxID=359158 RepID=A0A6H9Y5Q4_9ACTN|nr:alanine--tRNA ligase [Actinomadura rudentiformis]KAB2339339.1 alanine--tRNA ligase [Actinomadura rudentiformis]
MRSPDIRSTFLDFFSARDHRVVPSSPLIPNDPTLLLTAAGMNQFKPYMLGESAPEYRRATSVQKCARMSDIDNVGRTTRHATFFEMLGNFSFGDYFKEETVGWAWELLTGHFGLDPDRLWITVYLDDDEAERMWRRLGVPDERIQRLGMADNYWSMGAPGPCGPSSELHYDRGPSFGREGGPAVDGERYQEIWNLVFMQNLRGEGPAKEGYPIVGELPARNIDTGLGMDRLAAILQDVDTVCETDLVAPTFRLVQELAGREYPGRDGSEESVSFRVVAEHARSAAFLIADGVLPGKDGRGYVLRRLMRRAIRHARVLGIEEPALAALTGSVIDNLGPAWPELERRRDLIEQVVAAEEDGFDRTLRQGSRLLDGAIERARTSGSGLSGRTAFELHDTYGFPIDLTVDAARSAGLTVDEDAFGELLERQQRQAKDAERDRKGGAVARQDAYRRIAARHGLTEFVGHDGTRADARVVGLLDGPDLVEEAVEGQEIELILDRSPFYAEAGGQVGDTGRVTTAAGTLEILDTRPGLDGLHVHRARVTAGEVRTGVEAEAVVDAERRAATARSHSATHVLHAMLRRVLGDHAAQRGSRVEPGRLRFDFAHFGAVGAGELTTVQTLVNDYLLDDPDVRVWEASRDEAEAAGAIALFGEKYGDHVRIVDIGDASRELCGGTHVGHGSQAGPVHVVGESSIGVGLRRIEALTGADALRHHDRQQELLTELAGLLNVPPDQAPERLRQRLSALAETQRELDRLRQAERTATAERLAGRSERVDGAWLVAELLGDVPAEELRPLAIELARRPGPGAVVLGTSSGGTATLVGAFTRDLADTGLRARDLLTSAAQIVGGGAGGKGALAQAGGRRPEQLREALALAADAARTALRGPSSR